MYAAAPNPRADRRSCITCRSWQLAAGPVPGVYRTRQSMLRGRCAIQSPAGVAGSASTGGGGPPTHVITAKTGRVSFVCDCGGVWIAWWKMTAERGPRTLRPVPYRNEGRNDHEDTDGAYVP